MAEKRRLKKLGKGQRTSVDLEHQANYHFRFLHTSSSLLPHLFEPQRVQLAWGHTFDPKDAARVAS